MDCSHNRCNCYRHTCAKVLFASYTVKGASMHPTFKNREKVIVSRIAKTLDHIDTGDVVIFHANAKQDYIKRLIGKPGDSVEYKKINYI